MVEPEMPLKKKAQISLDEELAFKLQAEHEEEEERISREKALKANIAEWDDFQAMMDADYELAARLQEEKQGELTIKEKSRLFLKNKSFDEVKKAFNKTMSWINSFVSMDTEVVKDRAEGSEIKAEESSKRAREDLQQESTKKQKVDGDQEATKLKRCLEIVHDDKDDVTIDVEPLSFKSPTIIDYKIHKEGRKSYFQIIRADGSSQMYYTFSKMLKNFNKEDLEVL
nr:hypothetical protein [Tanacetum cinerariifolium]